MPRPANPFVLSGYYGKEWFCDRNAELRAMREHVRKENQNHLVHDVLLARWLQRL